jgi:hypothetical protein
MWVYDSNEFTAMLSELQQHFLRLWESIFIPCIIPFAVCVFDVKPDGVTGDFVL